MRQAPAARAPAPASAAAKASADDASAFSALDQWTSLNLTRAGQGSRQARGDTEGLAALVNAVARSATAPGAELAAPVEARLELYRGANHGFMTGKPDAPYARPAIERIKAFIRKHTG